VFKAPEEDHEEHSTTVPLLAAGDRELLTESEREEVFAEGPNSSIRGTLLDGIANVGREDADCSLLIAAELVDGQQYHRGRDSRVGASRQISQS
jgi:hypothetical protein